MQITNLNKDLGTPGAARSTTPSMLKSTPWSALTSRLQLTNERPAAPNDSLSVDLNPGDVSPALLPTAGRSFWQQLVDRR